MILIKDSFALMIAWGLNLQFIYSSAVSYQNDEAVSTANILISKFGNDKFWKTIIFSSQIIFFCSLWKPLSYTQAKQSSLKFT